MPRGRPRKNQNNMENNIVPINSAVQKILPEDAFTSLPWWEKLDVQEQSVVLSESQELGKAMLNYGFSRLAVGEHLSKLRDTLEPHNLFGKYLKNFHFSKRSAYRRISEYNNAKARLPQEIVKAAMVRGVNIVGDTDQKPLGTYTRAVAMLPPPTSPTPEQANIWLDQIEDVRRKQAKEEGATSTEAEFVPSDPNDLLKEGYKVFSRLFKKLPQHHKSRQAFVARFVGMMLTELGVSGAQTFHSQAIPEDFRTGPRGRPRSTAAAA